MASTDRERHRDRHPSPRQMDDAAEAHDPRRTFRITNEEREKIAKALRYIDEARMAIADQQNRENREIVRELQASADDIFDVLNGLEEIAEGR